MPSVFDSDVAWITFIAVPALPGDGAGGRGVLGDPPGDRQRAVGDRGAPADPRRPAQHVLRAVAADPCPAGAVGGRHGPAHHALRRARHRVHPEVAVGRQLPRHRGLRELLPVHRVRAAPGGRAGAGGGPAAATVRRGAHGPHHAGVGARLRGAGARHPPGGAHHADAGEPDTHAVRGRRDDPRAVRAGLRRHPDVDPGVAHRDPGAGGARGAQPGRAGRPRHQPGGLRRHRTRPAAAWLQLDGARAAGARTGARPVRPPRRPRGRSRWRSRSARSSAAKSATPQ